MDSSGYSMFQFVYHTTHQQLPTSIYNVDLNNKNYELSKLQLDKSNIISSSGGVIETINFKPGEYVNPGSILAEVMDLQSMYVRIYVPEKELTSISIEKEVKLKADYLKDKTINGKIIYISPEAEFTPMNIVTKADRSKLVYEVKVKVLDNIEYIKPGMLLDVNI
jgi:HlyD family secretion protein